MATEPDDQDSAGAREAAARRDAQDGAGELARMGIDPRELGLEPPPPRPAGPLPSGGPDPASGPPPGPAGSAPPEQPSNTPPRPAGSAPPDWPPSGPPVRGVAPPTGGAGGGPAPPSSAPPNGHQVGGAGGPGRYQNGPPATGETRGAWRGTVYGSPHGMAYQGTTYGGGAGANPTSPAAGAPVSGGPGGPAPRTSPTNPASPPPPSPPTGSPEATAPAGPPGTAPPSSPPPGPGAPNPLTGQPSGTGAGWVESTLNRPIGTVTRGPAPAAEDIADPLERLLATPTPPPPGGWRRAVRAATLGLIEPGAAAAIEQERQLVARARLRRAEPRVVAFVAGKGGVGTTTIAAGVAFTLATLRTDTTALITARAGGDSLGQRLVGQPAPPVPAVADREPAQEPLWVHSSLAVVDGPPWHAPTARESLVRLVDQLRTQHAFTVADVGNDLGEPAGGALERADQVVVVTGASQDSVAATRTALARIHQVDPFRLATIVVAVTCKNARQYRRMVQRLHTELGLRAARIVPIGCDPWLATGGRLDPARLRSTTREAYLRIAGLVVEPGRADQWFSQPMAPAGPAGAPAVPVTGGTWP